MKLPLSTRQLLTAAALAACLVPLVILLSLGYVQYQHDLAALDRVVAADTLEAARLAAREAVHPGERFLNQAMALSLLTLAAGVAAIVFGRGLSRAYRALADELSAQLNENRLQTLALDREKQRNELILNAAEEGILGLDRSGLVTFANPAAARLLGYAPGGLLGLRAHQVLRPAAAHQATDIAVCPFRATMQEGRSWRSPAEVGLRKDGSSFPAEYALAPVVEDGRVVGAVMTFRDVTDRLEAERAARLDYERTTAVAHAQALEASNQVLMRLSQEAQAANRLKSEFLATMSHELRTPLNSIIGYTDLVLHHEREPLEPKTRKHLGVVLRNARHLLELINDVLDLSRIEAGQMTVKTASVEPSLVMRSVEAAMAPLAQERGLKLQVTCDAGLGRVEVDEIKLRQVVLNLVSNGVKYTHSGTVTVTAGPLGTDRWQVVVADTGIGIAPEHHELIFEAFRQVDGTSTRAVGGTGLGLAIARRMARLMGGELTVASTLGAGSTFTLTLPRGRVTARLPDASHRAAS